MYQKRFIKINCIITLFTFLISIFSANFAFVGTASAEENLLNKITEGVWNVKNAKGEFTAAGNGGYETWADGKQRFVLRDTLGHLMSWGEAKIDKLSNGQVKVSVTGADGSFEAVKVSVPALETAQAIKSAVMDSAPASAVSAAPVAAETRAAVVTEPVTKTTIGQKLSALKTKITTPIENGGKGSTSWEKGYNFGKDTPTNLVNKVKGVFSKGDSSSAASTVTASAPAPSAAAPASTTAAPAAIQAPDAAVTTAAPAPKLSIGEKLSSLKTKITTPIDGGGKGSTAWEKGYSFGKDTPTNVVNKVKGVFTKGDSSSASTATASAPAATTTAAAGPNAPAPAAVPASTTAAPAAASTTVAAPSADASAIAAPATTAAPKATLGQKLSSLKTKVTTPIDGGGKGSAAWEKGYSFGKDTPTNAVNKVKGLFTKKSADVSAPASTPAAAGPDASAPAVETAPAAAAPAAEAPAKLTFGQKIKSLFKKPAAKAAATEAAAQEKTPSQKLSDQKDAEVKFDEKTGTFEKAPVVKVPTKLSTALSAGKDSLKSSFSVKNIGISAGLTVGFKIFEQVKNGEKVSIGKAVGHLASGEFVGSFVGSSLGSAAGSVVGSLVGSSIPVVGPILGAFMPAIFGAAGGQLGSTLGNDLATGQKFSFKKAWASIDKVAVLGQAVGSTVGAAIGSMLFPGIGSIVGGLVGGMIANVIVNKIRNRGKTSISGVNAMRGQIIYGDQVVPPPSQNVMNATGLSSTGSGNAQSTYEQMTNAYKRYSQLLSEGLGESSECQQALSQYKQLYTNYANSLQGQQK